MHFKICTTIATLILCVQWELAASAQKTPRTTTHRASTLVLDMPVIDLVPKDCHQNALQMFRFASSCAQYDCQLSEEFLNTALPSRVAIDAPFRDVIVQIPVRGRSVTEGTLRVDVVPDNTQFSLVFHFQGKVRMHGVGNTQGVRIDSNAVARFHAMKKIRCGSEKITCQPAICQVGAAMTIEGIRSSQPRLRGRIVERVATRRVLSSLRDAERECANHVQFALEELMDQQVEKLAGSFNSALRVHLASLSPEARDQWHGMRLRSNDRGCTITQGLWEPADLVEHRSLQKACVLAVPRTALTENPLGMLLVVGGVSGSNDDEQPSKLDALQKLRPAVEWSDQNVIVSLELVQPAQPPSHGATPQLRSVSSHRPLPR